MPASHVRRRSMEWKKPLLFFIIIPRIAGILKRSAYELAIRKSGAYKYGKYAPRLQHKINTAALPARNGNPVASRSWQGSPGYTAAVLGQNRHLAAAAPSPSQHSPNKLHPGCIVTETVSTFPALLYLVISLRWVSRQVNIQFSIVKRHLLPFAVSGNPRLLYP